MLDWSGVLRGRSAGSERGVPPPNGGLLHAPLLQCDLDCSGVVSQCRAGAGSALFGVEWSSVWIGSSGARAKVHQQEPAAAQAGYIFGCCMVLFVAWCLRAGYNALQQCAVVIMYKRLQQRW